MGLVYLYLNTMCVAVLRVFRPNKSQVCTSHSSTITIAMQVLQKCHVVLHYTKENYTNKNYIPSEDIIIQKQQTVVF